MAASNDLRAFSLAAALGGLGLLVGAPALAQSSVECSETGTDDERVACLQSRVDALEAELARARGELAAAAPAETPAPAPAASEAFGAEQIETPTVVAAPAAATAAAAPAAREGRRWLRMPSVPFFGRDDEDGAESAPTQVAAAPAPAPRQPAPSEAETFGAEQIASVQSRQEAREEDILHANIVDFQVLHRGRLVVALDNGQMWRQMSVESWQVRLDEGETYPVEIRRSGFGGYRMKIADRDRLLTVERLR